MPRLLAAFGALSLACALMLAVVAIPALLALPALADPPAAAARVSLPWGAWLVDLAALLAQILLPALLAAATGLVAVLPWPLRLFLTSTLVERLVRNAVDFALNAVAGAAKDRALDVPVGSAVLAAAVQRALDQAPAWLASAAGGREGIAEKVFRLLRLDETASAASVLAPVLREHAS